MIRSGANKFEVTTFKDKEYTKPIETRKYKIKDTLTTQMLGMKKYMCGETLTEDEEAKWVMRYQLDFEKETNTPLESLSDMISKKHDTYQGKIDDLQF